MKSYPNYKKSRSPLLGSIPSHWEENFLKRGFEITLGKMLQSDQKNDNDFMAPYLRSANVQWGLVDTDDVQEMWFSPREANQLTLNAGDMVTCEGGDAGRAAIWHGEIENCYFQNSVNRVRSSSGNSTSYLLYWMHTLKASGYVDIVCNKATISHLTKEKLGNLPMAYPPIDEQIAIATYLDTETKRIDGLIEDKIRLLWLVKKLSIAVIDDAIEGRAKIREIKPLDDWKKARLRFKANVNPRASVELDDDEYVSFLPMESIGEDGSLQLIETRKVADVSHGYTFFEEGDVTVAKITPCFENRKGAVMSGLIGGVGFGTTELIVLRPEADVDAKFLYYLTQSSRFRLNGEASMTGSGGQKRVSDLYVKDFETKWPPLDSQKQISTYIDVQLSRNAELVKHVEAELDLLKELRSSTITDAVLGRIDIRGIKTH